MQRIYLCSSHNAARCRAVHEQRRKNQTGVDADPDWNRNGNTASAQ